MADDGRMLQRVRLCVSRSAQPRSGAHATDSQLFTFPWGIPREAETEPESSTKPSLEHSAAEDIVAALVLSETLKGDVVR